MHLFKKIFGVGGGRVEKLLQMQETKETRVRALGWEDPLE